MVKKIISILIVAALPLGFAATAFSAQDATIAKAEDTVQQAQEAKEERCTVTKIEGTRINMQNEKNEPVAMVIKDPQTLEGLKVGDKVLVRNGEVMKQKEE